MNIPTQTLINLSIQLAPVVIELYESHADQNTVITKLVQFAERMITGEKKGSQRLELVLGLIRSARPAMLATADKLDEVQRKIGLAVLLLKDLDDNDTGLDDLIAEKLATTLNWIGGLSRWVRKQASKAPDFSQNNENG